MNVETLRRLNKALQHLWDCGRPGCDGLPHSGLPFKHARAGQIAPPGDWWAWFYMAGRGAGKTRSGGEYVKKRMLAVPHTRVAIIERDRQTARDVTIEGESGLLGQYDGQGSIPWNRVASWNRSQGELILKNGSMAKLFGTDTKMDAEKLRGYQCHVAWFEELGTQKYGDIAWKMLEFALRLGDDPRIVITSTPRNIPIIRKLVDDPDVVVTRGRTFDNADNIPAKTLERLKSQHGGTTLGRQELDGELLADSPGALWKTTLIQHTPQAPCGMNRIVVAVDPAGTNKPTSDLTGICVVGLGEDGRLYVLRDASGRYSPEQWRSLVKRLYDEYQADAVVAEVNFGADLVAANLRALPREERPRFKSVNASRGKKQRFEPVVGLYEQKRVLHVGAHPELEDQMTQWVPPGQFDEDGEPVPESKESPDRVDAMAWGVTELALVPLRQRGGMRFGDV